MNIVTLVTSYYVSSTPFAYETQSTVLLVDLELCNLNNLKSFLVISQQLYIFDEQVFWIEYVKDKIYSKPNLS